MQHRKWMVMTWGQVCPYCKVKRDCHICETNKHPGYSKPIPSETEKTEEDPITLDIAKRAGCLLDGNRVELENFSATFKIFDENLYLVANDNKRFKSFAEFIKETMDVEDIDDLQYNKLIINGKPWKQ